MAIQISAPESMPAIVYDRIHMTKMIIDQPTQINDADLATYHVDIYYRLYGIVNNVRYYKDGDVSKISIPSFLVEALTKRDQGDTTLITAFTAIEQAVSLIIAEKAGLNTAVI